jgi:hypothetical protein
LRVSILLRTIAFRGIWHQPRSLFRRVGVRGGGGVISTAAVPIMT